MHVAQPPPPIRSYPTKGRCQVSERLGVVGVSGASIPSCNLPVLYPPGDDAVVQVQQLLADDVPIEALLHQAPGGGSEHLRLRSAALDLFGEVYRIAGFDQIAGASFVDQGAYPRQARSND